MMSGLLPSHRRRSNGAEQDGTSATGLPTLLRSAHIGFGDLGNPKVARAIPIGGSMERRW